MISRLICRSILLVAICAVTQLAPAQDDALRKVRDQHGWGRFGSGTWKRIRVVSETLDENGKVVATSTTETKTTLTKVDDKTFTIKVEATVDVAGRKINSPAKMATRGYFGEAVGEKVEVRESGEQNVTIGDKRHACLVREVEITGANRRRKVRVFLSRRAAPTVLRKIVTGAIPNEDTKTYETVLDVIALDMPHRVAGKTLSTSHIRQIHTNNAGTTITLAVHSNNVPGEVVAYWAKELDAKERVIRRRTLEVMDFHVVPAPRKETRPTSLRERIRKRREERLKKKQGE